MATINQNQIKNFDLIVLGRNICIPKTQPTNHQIKENNSKVFSLILHFHLYALFLSTHRKIKVMRLTNKK
ncbi:MAG: hypothetical protein WC872_04540 [Candidatus Absconditabacterales bacterium]